MSSHTSRSTSELSAAERAFYSRQLILPVFALAESFY